MTARWKRIASRSMCLAKDKRLSVKVLKPASEWPQNKNNKIRINEKACLDRPFTEVEQ